MRNHSPHTLPPPNATRPSSGHARRSPRISRAARHLALYAAALLLAGCATPTTQLRTGQDEAAVRATLGPPTGEYPLAGGARRLEYARGPFGKQTWMVDLDAAGRVAQVAQVLVPHYFAQVHSGMTRAEVLPILGRPGFRQREFRDKETWSWRFENPFCDWAQVTFAADGRVVDGVAQAMDPTCAENR